MTRVYQGTYSWMAASLGGENPQPVFRDRNADMTVVALPGLPEGRRQHMGRACGRRILPYRVQDRYDRNRRCRDFQALILENDILKATFLPELGGRLMSLIYKPEQRELLFNNPVFQPANLAGRDAWFAGGIEWNVGQFGHAFQTCTPVFAAAIPGVGGGQGLRLYDFERCTGLFWQMDFHLPMGSEFLQAFIRVINPRDAESQMYWWSNTAVAEAKDVRVLAPTRDAVYVDLRGTVRGEPLAYGQMTLPGLPTIDDGDGTYSTNVPFASEFYFQCEEADLPWEAALDAQGNGFVEASTHPLHYRKLFCWGMHQGGRHWQEFLANPGLDYLEIQAGLAPTQIHGLTMPGRAQWSWTQVFGYLKADPSRVHAPDWDVAWKTADTALKRKLTAAQLGRIQELCRMHADTAPLTLLHHGLGWGALELRRRSPSERAAIPAALVFPDSILGAEQKRWLTLLETGTFPEPESGQWPGEWMIQSEWRTLLEMSQAIPANRNAFALLHLGVMRMEAFDEAGAVAAWEESVRLLPSAWGWRNLGAAAVRRGEQAESVPFYRKAWELASRDGNPDQSFAQELLLALHLARANDEAWTFYEALPEALRKLDTITLLAAKIAFARGDLSFVEDALKIEYSSLREGARDLTDLWFGVKAMRLAQRRGCQVDDALRAEVQTTFPPPRGLDFRIIE